MSKQRGGSFTVNGWLAMFLLAAAIAGAAMNIYLMRRTIRIELPTVVITAPPKDDYGVVHMYPPDDDFACEFNNTICTVKI